MTQAGPGTHAPGNAPAPPKVFEGAGRKALDAVLKKYPEKQAALLPALWIVQEKLCWVPPAAIAEVAEVLGLTVAYVKGVVTFYTLFGLLYTTGLRVGEAISLDLADVDLARQRIYIHRSKFRKSRWVPLSASTCSVLQRYIQERTRIFPAAPQDPLFANLQGRRLFLQIVYTAFRQALSRCGLRGGKGDPGPRIHDLRHSYACNRLLAAYRQGGDVNALLPALATYLGHVCITYTQVYLRATAELLEMANQRFHNNFLQNVLKKGE